MASQPNSKLLRAARAEAARQVEGVRLNIDPADALQEVLDRAVEMLRWAGKMAGDLPQSKLFIKTPFGTMEHEYLRLEKDLRVEVGGLAGRMVALNLVDRQTRVEEARAALYASAVAGAMRDAGLGQDEIRKVGVALRNRLTSDEQGQLAA